MIFFLLLSFLQFSPKVSIKGNFIVFVLLFAQVERFGVSRMRDLKKKNYDVFKYTETLVLFLNFDALYLFT